MIGVLKQIFWQLLNIIETKDARWLHITPPRQRHRARTTRRKRMSTCTDLYVDLLANKIKLLEEKMEDIDKRLEQACIELEDFIKKDKE